MLEKLIDLLADWEAQREDGREVALEQVFGKRPDLQNAARQLIKMYSFWEGVGSTASTDLPQQASTSSISGHSKQLRTASFSDLPQDFGDYRLLQLLGRGGMGEVYKAEHKLLRGKICALKIISPSRPEIRGVLSRFLTADLEAHAPLDHKNIVRADTAQIIGDKLVLQMEYVDGDNLRDFVKKRGPLEADVASELIKQVACGMQYAHEYAPERGIVHRDIKPENVMRDKQGCVKILDLGIARVRDELGWATDIFMGPVGTPEYMAPEQFSESGNVDRRADIYSLGCTYFFLLAGRPPYGARPEEHWLRIIDAHALKTIPFLAEMSTDIPPSVSEICAKMMAKKPHERYQSMQEVIAALDSVLGKRTEPRALGNTAPRKLAHFVGRESDLTQLERALTQPKPAIVVVVGIGGQGKTSLVAEWLDRQRVGDFDAVFWWECDNAAGTFDYFLDETLAFFLGERFDKKAHALPGKRKQELLEQLRRCRALIVLDGMERWLKGWCEGDPRDTRAMTRQHRRGHDPILDDFLREASGLTNGSHVVITTRLMPSALARETNVLRETVPAHEKGEGGLGGLEDDDAVKLLGDLGVQGADENVLEIARGYDNHPLALCAIGALVVECYGGDIAKMPEDALPQSDDLDSLLETIRRYLPDRETSERFLHVAAVCIGPPSLKVLAAGLGQDCEQTWQELQEQAFRLQKWHLLKCIPNAEAPEDATVELHGLIKGYFSRHVRQADAPDVHARLRAHYASLPIAEQARSVKDVNNRIWAIEHAIKARDIRECRALFFRQTAGYQTLTEWLIACGHMTAGIELLTRAAGVAVSDAAAKADFMISRAAMRRVLGDLESAKDELDNAIELLDTSSRTEGQRVMLAEAHNNRGNVQWECGYCAEALGDYSFAVRQLRSRALRGADRALRLAKILINHANALTFVGSLKAASRDLRLAERLCERVGLSDPMLGEPLLALVLWQHSTTALYREEFTTALRLADRVIAIYQKLFNDGRTELEPLLAIVRVMRARVLTRMEKFEEAVKTISESISELEQIIDRGRPEWAPHVAVAHIERAIAAFGLRNTHAATRDCDDALKTLKGFDPEGVQAGTACALLVRATACHAADYKTDAKENRDEAIEILGRLRRRGAYELLAAYLPISEVALGRLLCDDPTEAVVLLNVVLEDIHAALRSQYRLELIERAAERIVVWIQHNLSALETVGFEKSKLLSTIDMLRARRWRAFFRDAGDSIRASLHNISLPILFGW